MIVEDSNGLWTERSPIVQQSWDQHRALEVQASSPQSEETRRHRLQQRHQQPMKMQQNYQSECWQQQPVGNKRLYAAPTSRGGSKTAVRLWALRSALLRSALLHCALLWALQCLSAPPRDLDTEQDTASPLFNYLCTPAPPTALWHRSPCVQYICEWLCNVYCTVDAKSSARLCSWYWLLYLPQKVTLLSKESCWGLPLTDDGKVTNQKATSFLHIYVFAVVGRWL